MWLCTQNGFYSVVFKEGLYCIRARVRQDLEDLRGLPLLEDVTLPEIEEWPQADYRWRIRVTGGVWLSILEALGEDLDYSNFKSRIAELSRQRPKLDAYHDLWAAGLRWQKDAENQP